MFILTIVIWMNLLCREPGNLCNYYNIGAAESAAKRLGLTGNLICVDKKQSEELERGCKYKESHIIL
jgi:hypothetical protein